MLDISRKNQTPKPMSLPPAILIRRSPVSKELKQGKGRRKKVVELGQDGQPRPKLENEAEWRIAMYKRSGYTFNVDRYGSTVKIALLLHNGKWHHKAYYKNDGVFVRDATPEELAKILDSKNAGFHICRMVEKDVKSWIADHPDVDYTSILPIEPVLQFVNPEAIQKMIKFTDNGEQEPFEVAAVDASDCFFTTGMNQGFIRHKTAALSHKKSKQWKFGRNASIGRFATIHFKESFVDGVKQGDIPPVMPNMELKWVRQQIILRAQEMAFEIAELVGPENFYFWLTDCAYVNPKVAGMVQKYFQERNYGSSLDIYDFLYFQQKNKSGVDINKIYWIHPTRYDEEPKYFSFGSKLTYQQLLPEVANNKSFDYLQIMDNVEYGRP